jgi:hypothetical protein
MLDGRTRDRVCGVTAIAYALLMAAGWAAWAGQGLPALNGPSTEVASWFVQHHDACRVAAILGSLSLFPLIWYLVCLYGTLRDAEGGNGAVSLVFLGGGLMTVVFDMMFCQFLLTAAFRPGQTLPAVTQALNDLYLGPGVAALTMYMAMFVAIALIVLRSGVLPAALGYGALAVAAAQLLFVPTSFVHEGIFDISKGLLGVYVPFGSHIVWILISGIVVLQHAREPRSVVTPATVGRARA